MKKHKAAGITPAQVVSVLITELGLLCMAITETRADYDKLVTTITKSLAAAYDIAAAYQNNRN